MVLCVTKGSGLHLADFKVQSLKELTEGTSATESCGQAGLQIRLVWLTWCLVLF